MSVGVLDEETPYVTEDLTEEEAYLFAILTDESGLDQAEFLIYDPACEDNEIIVRNEDGTCARDDAGQVKRERVRPAPSGCFRAWDFQVWWWRNPEMYQIDQCVAEGQLILTKRGWVPIEEVVVGDYTLTHLGRWRMVTHVWDRGVRDVVEVKAQGHHGFKVTPDHRLMARRSRRGSKAKDGHKGKVLEAPEWITPANWEWNDGSGRMVTNLSTSPTFVEPCELPDQMRPAYASGRQNYVADFLDDDWLWLYGLYLAEGSTFVSSTDLTHRACWSVHSSELAEIEKRLRSVGLNYSVDRRGSCAVVSVNSRPVVEWLLAEGGHLAHGKSVGVWVYGLSDDKRRQVFDGAIFGDGHIRPNGRIEYTTVSRSLAYGIKVLAATLGYSVSIRVTPEREGVIEGRSVHCRDRYELGFEPLFGQARARCVDDAGVMWAPVTSIEPVGQAHVYDLEVDEDHSFTVEGIGAHNCARSVGKSQSILVRGCAFPFVHPGLEMVVTAPELIHLEPIVSKVEQQFYATWFLSQMLPRGKSAITHRPFQMNFLNGARIIGRIPQRDGKGVKGIHPIWLELDEAQDYPKAGWKELTETLKRGVAGARWRAHGVTRGVRDDFYEKTQDSSNWHVHRFPAMWRPNWTDKEREDAIAEYDSRDDPDYRRNVLGLHGDATNPIFVLTQLMKNVDNDPLSDYNAGEYFKQVIKAEELELLRVDITHFLDFPAGHLAYLGDAAERKAVLDGRKQPRAIYWVGMDVGFTIDPSEILIFVEYREKPRDPVTKLRLLSRLSLWRMPVQQQVMAMLAVIDFYRPKVFALDRNGIGLPLWQLIQDHLDAFKARDLDKIPAWFHGFDLERAATSIKGYTFGQNLIVDFDKTIEVGRFDDAVEKAGMKREAKAYSTDQLRELVDQSRLWLPWDEDFLKQFQGATWTAVKGGIDQYGRRMFSKGNDHCLDAAREMALGWAQYSIEETIAAPKTRVPVYDSFVEM